MESKNKRLLLRRVLDKDLPALFKFRNDERIWYWCRQNAPLHWEAHLEWYRRQSADPRLSMFSIVSLDLNSVIGVCGLTDIDLVNRRAEFSLYIDPDLQGQGYGKEALETLLTWGFSYLGLNRVWGEVYRGNPAYDVFLSMGFEQEGTRFDFYQRNANFIDALLISISAKFHLSRVSVSDKNPKQHKIAKRSSALKVRGKGKKKA